MLCESVKASSCHTQLKTITVCIYLLKKFQGVHHKNLVFASIIFFFSSVRTTL